MPWFSRILTSLFMIHCTALGLRAQPDKTAAPQANARQLGAFSAWTQTILFSPDGKTLYCSFRNDKERPAVVRFINVESGKTVHEFSGGFQAALTPDGKVLAVNRYREKHVCLWSTETRKELKRVETEQAAFEASFSPDGRLLAVAKGDRSDKEGVIEVWNWQKGERTCTLALDQGVTGFLFAPDGRSLFLNDGDGNLASRALDDGAEIRKLHSPADLNNKVRHICPDRTGRRALATSADFVDIWDLSDFKRLKSVPIVAKAPLPRAMAADDKWMYLFSQSAGAFSPVGEIAAYHLENGERSQIYKFPAFFATAMAVSPDQKNLAVGTSKGVVLLLPINR